MLLLCILFSFMLHACHAVLTVHCSLVAAYWERAGLLPLLYVMFSCVLVTFQCGVLDQVWNLWNLIVSILDLCSLPYFLILIFAIFEYRKLNHLNSTVLQPLKRGLN